MKRIFFLLAFVLLSTRSFAQHPWARPYFEAGILAGVSSYSGELVNTMVDVKHLHMAFGVFGRYNFNKYLTFRLQGAYGTISGNDKDSKNISKQARNLHFRSHILEFSAIGEFNLIGYNPVGHGKMFSPYAFLGFSIFNYNPKAQHFDPKMDGEWIDLQPLRTEGQGLNDFPNRTPYSLTNVSIPMGLGIKYAINSNINLGFEIGIRTTFTDYLDDVSLTYAVSKDINQNTTSLYDQTPYSNEGLYTLGTFSQDANGNSVFTPERSLSFQEIMADGSYLLAMNENKQIDKNKYEKSRLDRNGDSRGANGSDLYLIAGLTISYNFTDEGLSRQGFRQRRKRKGGCKSAQF